LSRKVSPLAESLKDIHTQKVIDTLEEFDFEIVKIALKDVELVNISGDFKNPIWRLSGKVLRFGKGVKAGHSVNPESLLRNTYQERLQKYTDRFNQGGTLFNPRTLLVEAWDKCFQIYKKTT
jgi:hypothetical protein